MLVLSLKTLPQRLTVVHILIGAANNLLEVILNIREE